MKNTYPTSIFLLFLVVSFSNCERDKNNNPDEITDVTSMITPRGVKLPAAEDGPVRSALGEPSIDLNEYQLEISGLVDSSLIFEWDEIQALPAVNTDTMLMYCVEGWEVWGNWKGVLVKDLLDKASIKKDGEYVLFSCVEGYTTALPISYLIKYNAMLAYEVNGLPLEPSNGFPLRLVTFGKLGYKWAKWVNKMEVLDQTQIGYWEDYGYSDKADVPVDRRKYYEGLNAQALEY